MARKARKTTGEKVLQVPDGEWTKWSLKEDHVCCDCGLSHGVECRIVTVKGKLQFEMKWTRNDAKTKRMRKRFMIGPA